MPILCEQNAHRQEGEIRSLHRSSSGIQRAVTDLARDLLRPACTAVHSTDPHDGRYQLPLLSQHDERRRIGVFHRIVRTTSLSKVQTAFVGLVSVYDAWLIVRFADMIWYTEENPVGMALLRVADGGIGLFVASKLAGSALALAVLLWLMSRHREIARPVLNAVTTFQAWLLWYLTVATPGHLAIPIARQMTVIVMIACCVAPLFERRRPRTQSTPIDIRR